jgi:alpha-N-arabinofuranosidase
VRLWCLGNEMDGSWQIGHCPPEEYAARAVAAARLMRGVDPGIETVACGSSMMMMESFADWDARVLAHMDDAADFISLHCYVGNWSGDTRDYLAVPALVDRQIEAIDAVARAVQARRKSARRIRLSFDEWNVWYRTMTPAGISGGGAFPAHLIEEVYDLQDALVVAGFLHSFLRHADCVAVANLAQIVNVIAPLLTRGDELLVQSIFHPLAMMATRRGPVALRVVVAGPTYRSPTYGEVTEIDASAMLDGDRLHVFATNRSLDAPAPLTIAPADRAIAALVDAELLSGPAPTAANSFEQPDVVRSTPFDAVRVADGRARLSLPPLSFAALTFALRPA